MKNILSLFAALACVISSALALNPSRDYEMTPKDVDLAFEEVTIPTEDGANGGSN